MSDSFATRDQLSVNGQNYTIFSLQKIAQQFRSYVCPLDVLDIAFSQNGGK